MTIGDSTPNGLELPDADPTEEIARLRLIIGDVVADLADACEAVNELVRDWGTDYPLARAVFKAVWRLLSGLDETAIPDLPTLRGISFGGPYSIEHVGDPETFYAAYCSLDHARAYMGLERR